ncbi:MAG: hypothetical protein N3D75_00925 [Candidatus Aenigmarchaeota archaeon]|nr:hypothetical protein [Candidatus Aenigmarchaeota archaeon]
MNIDALRKGKKLEITVCCYSERCGASKKPYSMIFGKDNTGYIIQISGDWNYSDDHWSNEIHKIRPGDRLLVEIEKIDQNIAYARIIRSYQ